MSTNMNLLELADKVEGAAKLLRHVFPQYGKPDWATLGRSYESALSIAGRRSADMALYLRERRDPTGMRAFHRKRALSAALRAQQEMIDGQ